ncbi:MAG: LytR family transcriptional regulator [Bacteroides sp. SM1_62]|nr:MAG: LytR family transcriptional regulator [Bacteroides sp. SM23_62]KPL25147.1 MAG: LytR family transcriptional regulator [Bacteroides sp. SM1_62]
MIKTIIVEDEKLARDLIKDYLENHEDFEMIGEYEDGFSGLKAINEMKPDLVFLDIQMPKLTGFEMLEVLEHHPAIIFTTAYDQYALKAFEHNALDYLLKPYSKDRFDEAVGKARERVQSGDAESINRLVEHREQLEEEIHRVVVKSRSKIHVIPVNDIIYLEAQDDYVMVYTRNSKHLKQKTMKFFEAHLPAEDFVRIHRSYIVRLSEISQMQLYEKESYIVILKNGVKLPVSKSGLPKLKKKLDF